MQRTPGDRVGPFEIRALIGTGGMGAVYRAYDARLRRDVALKFLHPSEGDGDTRRLLLREARAASALSHPNICTVFDVGDDAASPYIAMEYLEGEPLGRQLPPEVVVRYGIQIAEALAHAHSRGIIHRDLKPANIIATADGRVKVLDFGLATKGRTAAAATTRAETSLELEEAWGGTIAYMAPEVLRGGKPDERSDLWALGVVLHHLASGSLPFRGETATQMISAILQDPPTPLPPTVPAGLRTTIGRLLARDPSERFHSAGEVRAVLEAAQETTSSDPAVPPVAVSRRRTWWIRAALAAAACLALVWLVVRYAGGSPGLRLRDHRLVSTVAATQNSPSFSPDADLVAFVAPDGAGVPQLWVQNLAQGAPIQVTTGGAAVERPRWSPAGDQILFNRLREGIWSVAPLGGTPHRVVEQGMNANFSRDGRRIVYEWQSRIWTADADGSNARLLEGIPAKYYSVPAYPAWSPDDGWIAYFRPEAGPNGDLWIAPANGGEPRRLTFDMREGGAPVWTPDGTRIVFSSARAGSRTLWQIDVDGGEPIPVTTGTGDDDQPDISRDGTRLIYTNVKNTWELRVRDTDSAADRLLLEKRREINFPMFSPDGSRLAFFGREGRAVAIFTIGVDGTDLRQLTGGTELNHQPRWSADGAWVYFYQITPSLSFRRVPAVGGPSEEVLPWRWETHNGVQFSAKGDWLLYVRRPDATIVRNVQTGSEHQLASGVMVFPRWSRDGQFVAGSAGERVVICPAGGSPCRTIADGYMASFSADGTRVYFLRRGSAVSVHQLLSVDLGGRDLRIHGELGPFRGNLDLFYDVSSRGAIAWGLYREGRRELWAASLD